jgi:hypothetical protein
MKRDLHPRDAELAAVPGTNPRQIGRKVKPNWKQKLMGGLVKGEDGKYRPAPEKEDAIEDFTGKYGKVRGLWRVRIPDILLKSVYGRGKLLDQLVAAAHPSMAKHLEEKVMILRKLVKISLGSMPDDIFLDPNPLPDGTHRALVIENKTLAGKLSTGQRMTDARLGGMHVTRSTAAVKAAIDAFCDKKTTPSEVAP